MIRTYDRDQLREQFRSATPFPFVCIEHFLEPKFAAEVTNAYPVFGSAKAQGHMFKAVNEKNKVQITEEAKFPNAVKKLNALISSPEFMADLEYVTGIEGLVYDASLQGGGMHLTGPRGRLDVHVDFNYEENQKLYRRLNILIYLNEGWRDEWGGAVELWDPGVKKCHHALLPLMNRCVIFETSDISYHGVQPVTCPDNVARISFAAYYYTKTPPAGFKGEHHSTIFRARPTERLRGWVLMPLEKVSTFVLPRARRVLARMRGSQR